MISKSWLSMRVIFIFLHRPITKAWIREVCIFELEIFQALRSVGVKYTSIFCKISPIFFQWQHVTASVEFNLKSLSSFSFEQSAL